MSCLANAVKLQEMMGQGQMMEAFEQFYHDNVVVVDGNMPPRNGKDAQREALNEWQKTVKEVHAAGIGAITANEETNTSCVESWMEATFADGKRVKMEEVAVQKWDGDKIIHERFYYTMPDM